MKWAPDWYDVTHMREAIFIEEIQHGPRRAVWGKSPRCGMVCLQDECGRRFAARKDIKTVLQLSAAFQDADTLEVICTTVDGTELEPLHVHSGDSCGQLLQTIAKQMNTSAACFQFLLEDGRTVGPELLDSHDETAFQQLASIASSSSGR